MALSTALSHFFQTFDETIEEEKHNKFIIWQVKDFYSLFHKLEKYSLKRCLAWLCLNHIKPRYFYKKP